jgi:hypothetical protein
MQLRDSKRDTAGMANHMLSVGRTLWKWAGPLGIVDGNPFLGVADLETDDAGHIPWPRWASDHVLQTAPPDLVRLVRLGLATCQRESDLIRMGPEHREGLGICRARWSSYMRFRDQMEVAAVGRERLKLVKGTGP